MSDRDVMQRALNEAAKYQGKNGPADFDNNADRGNARQEFNRGPIEVAPHMRSYAGGKDTTPAERARQAREDANRFGPPPTATKP
jgi:hypothetical protein